MNRKKEINKKPGTFLGAVARRFYYGNIREDNKQDHIHQWLLRLTGLSVILTLVFLILELISASGPAIEEFGLPFLWRNEWDPIDERYGALSFIYGTVVTSLLALFLAAPFSVGTALFITQLCPRMLKGVLSFLIEILAAIPSIVYGMWALFYLAPLIRDPITPFLKSTLGFLPFFQGSSFGIGMLTASIILSIMITPIITAVSVEVFKKMPELNKQGALALGATRAEMIWLAVFKPGVPGVMGAIILGLGRAFGETMAVAMVIGNKADISLSLFAPASTMAAVIANEYAEATEALQLGALSYIGLVLFIVSLIINLISRYFVWRFTRLAREG